MLQVAESLVSPKQSFPLNAGGGLVQCRVRPFKSPPQTALYGVQDDHKDHFPSKKIYWRNYICIIISLTLYCCCYGVNFTKILRVTLSLHKSFFVLDG